MYCRRQRLRQRDFRGRGRDATHHGDQVHVTAAQVAPEQRTADCSETENEDFDRVGVLGGEAEGRGVGVVDCGSQDDLVG